MASQVDRAFIPWYESGDLSAIPPPPGETSNFKNPYSLAYLDVVTLSVCWTVATLAIAMRTYTKLGILRNPGWDDYTALIAYFLLLAFGIVCLISDHHGNGRHLWNLTGWDYVAYAKATWANEIIYNPAMLFTKLSIFLLYLRVFNPIMRTSIILHVCLWLNVTFYFCGAFIEAFQCMPIQKAWYPLMDGHCISQQAVQIGSAIFNAISDFAILILPAGSIWNLHIHRQGKIGLFVIFSFGILGCVASVSRCVLFGTYGKVTHDRDGTWVFYPLNLLSTAELTCGLICSCLPALPAFLRHVSGIKIRVMISNEKIRHRGPNGYQSYPPDSRSRQTPGYQHYHHRDGHVRNGVKRASKFLMMSPAPNRFNGLQSSLSPSDSASKANSNSTSKCSHCSHCRQDRAKAMAAANAVPVSPSPENLYTKDRKGSSTSAFFFSPPNKTGLGSPRKGQNQAQFALNSIGGRPLPPLPPASESTPRLHPSSSPVPAVADDGYEDDNDNIIHSPLQPPVTSSRTPIQSPTSGRDPYEELDALTYEDGDELRSPSEAETTTSPGTGAAAGAGGRWANDNGDHDHGDYFGRRMEGGGPEDLEKGTMQGGGGAGKLAKMGFS